jgi:MoaA/NifB/PqqE/SkfB family radical SAM enzyme
VIISIAISDLNYDKLIPTYELARSLGVDGFNVNHLWMQTNNMVKDYNAQPHIFPADLVEWDVRPEMIDVENLATGLEAIRRRNWGSKFLLSEAPYLNRDEIAMWYRYPELPVKYQTVRCGWIRYKVWPDGRVKPCRDWEVGDINQQHVMEIWNGDEYQEFRQALSTQGMLPICTRCCQIAVR